MYIDKRAIYFIMAIMVVSGLISYINSPSSLVNLLLTIPGVLIAITFHEFAHAYAADKLGDDTPRSQGRLTLNPFAHGFGWGKPVVVNPRNYDRRMSMDKADAIVSVAGPLMNFVLSIILTLIYCAIYKFCYNAIISSQILQIIMLMIYYAISINVGLGLFNLIPLPPLDGSKVIKPLLPFNAREWFESNQQTFEIIFAVLWILGILGRIISPLISIVFTGVMRLGTLIFGIKL